MNILEAIDHGGYITETKIPWLKYTFMGVAVVLMAIPVFLPLAVIGWWNRDSYSRM